MPSPPEFTFSSGLPSLDGILQGILPGDNVVWQVDSLDDYAPFVDAFTAWALDQGRRLVYFRFAQHPPLLPAGTGAKVYTLDPRDGFEHFIEEILTVVGREGRGVCYVFDSLSVLSVDWYSDRMLGNFFRLACPYLYSYDTVAYFGLLRDVHTPLSINAIHTTAQVVLDVHRREGRTCLLPLKVLGRYTPTMYMLHSRVGDTFQPVTKSIQTAAILADVPQPWLDRATQTRDPWLRMFLDAGRLADAGAAAEEAEQLKEQLIKMVITRDANLVALCLRYLTIDDLLAIGRRMIGTGLIGGKSTGMLLARAIMYHSHPKWRSRLEAHDSFYIGSDVFYTFVIQNDCWWARHQMRSSADLFGEAAALREKLITGLFPADIEDQFREILNYFGQSPIIVRSSSLLEDAYGNAFSGKYESVFCPNQGTPEERLEQFKAAVRTIYASTMSRDALAYRQSRGLIMRDEQMALLVQRVSGEFFGPLYFPHAAGVGYSFNPFVWDPDIDPQAGLLRLVFGLGTRAVDRHDDDYTRIVAVNAPLKRPEATFDDLHRFSQRVVDVLDLDANRHAHISFDTAARTAVNIPLSRFATFDYEMDRRARDMGLTHIFPWVLTFDELLTATGFLDEMREILHTLAGAYAHPVDIEFTVNFLTRDDFRINLLQCRPFQVKEGLVPVTLPENPDPARVVLATAGPIIGEAVTKRIDRIIYIVPARYSVLNESQRYSVARLIGEIMNAPDAPPVTMLVGPGRWGTKMPAMGVPVTFAEIRNAAVICEVVTMHAGLTPDISLGTHFFNDLVEMGIVYIGLYPERPGYRLNEEWLLGRPNLRPGLVEARGAPAEAVHVCDAAPAEIIIHADVIAQRSLCVVS